MSQPSNSKTCSDTAPSQPRNVTTSLRVMISGGRSRLRSDATRPRRPEHRVGNRSARARHHGGLFVLPALSLSGRSYPQVGGGQEGGLGAGACSATKRPYTIGAGERSPRGRGPFSEVQVSAVMSTDLLTSRGVTCHSHPTPGPSLGSGASVRLQRAVGVRSAPVQLRRATRRRKESCQP